MTAAGRPVLAVGKKKEYVRDELFRNLGNVSSKRGRRGGALLEPELICSCILKSIQLVEADTSYHIAVGCDLSPVHPPVRIDDFGRKTPSTTRAMLLHSKCVANSIHSRRGAVHARNMHRKDAVGCRAQLGESKGLVACPP